MNNKEKALYTYATIQKRKAKENKLKEQDIEIYFKKRLGKLGFIKNSAKVY